MRHGIYPKLSGLFTELLYSVQISSPGQLEFPRKLNVITQQYKLHSQHKMEYGMFYVSFYILQVLRGETPQVVGATCTSVRQWGYECVICEDYTGVVCV